MEPISSNSVCGDGKDQEVFLLSSLCARVPLLFDACAREVLVGLRIERLVFTLDAVVRPACSKYSFTEERALRVGGFMVSEPLLNARDVLDGILSTAETEEPTTTPF